MDVSESVRNLPQRLFAVVVVASLVACSTEPTLNSGPSVLSLSPSSVVMFVGDTARMTVQALGAAAERNSESWISSDTTLVRIHANGLLEGLRTGTVKITVHRGEFTTEGSARVNAR